MKTRYLPIILAALVLVASSLACVFGELSLSNVRTALDQEGNQTTSVFSPSDTIYVLADLSSAPKGTVVKSNWFAVSVTGEAPNTLINEAEYTVTDDFFTGNLYFSLTPESAWPAGTYAVELYLNGTLIQTVTYSVQ